MKIMWFVIFLVNCILWVIISMVWCCVVNFFIKVSILSIYLGLRVDVGLLNNSNFGCSVIVLLIFICCCCLLESVVG